MINLSWSATAASCAPVTLPPEQPSFADAKIDQVSDVGVIASWPYQSPTRTGRLYARFVFENNVWGLCSWDIADV